MSEHEKFRLVSAAPGWRVVYLHDTGADRWQPLEAGEPVIAWLIEVKPNYNIVTGEPYVVVRGVLPTGQPADNAWGFLAPDGQAFKRGGDAYASLEAADKAEFESRQGRRRKKKSKKKRK
jgi:hypothetical protein